MIQDPAALMMQMEKDLNTIQNLAAELNSVKSQIFQIKNMITSAQGQAKIDLAVQAIELGKKGAMLYNEIKEKSSSIVTGSQNAAPYTVRDAVKQNGIDTLVAQVNMLQRSSQSANIAIASTADLLINIAKPTAVTQSTPEVLKVEKEVPTTAAMMSANTDKGIQPFRYMRRRGF